MSTNLYLDARLFKGLSVPKPPEVDDDVTQQESSHVTQLFGERSTGGQGAAGTRGANPGVKTPSPSGEQRDYYDPTKVKVKSGVSTSGNTASTPPGTVAKSGDSPPDHSYGTQLVDDLSKLMKKSLEDLDKGMTPPKTASTTPAGSGGGPAMGVEAPPPAAAPAGGGTTGGGAPPPPAEGTTGGGPAMGGAAPPPPAAPAGGTTPPAAPAGGTTPPAAPAGGTTPPAAPAGGTTPPPISEHPVQPQTPESHPPNVGPVAHIPHTDGTHTQVHAQDHKLHFTHVDQNGKNTVSHPPMDINDTTHVNPNDRGGYHLTVPSKLADKTEHTEVPLHNEFDKASATGGRHHVSHDVVSSGVGGADHLQEIQGHIDAGRSVIVPAGEGGDKHGVHQHIEDTLAAGGDLGFKETLLPNNDLHLAPKKGAKGEGAPETEEAKPATPGGVEPEVETPKEPEVETPKEPEVETPKEPEVDTPEPEVDTPEPEVDTPEPETRSISEIEAELRDNHNFTPEDLKELAAHVGSHDHEPHAEPSEPADRSWDTHSTGHATYEEAEAAAEGARRTVGPKEEARLKEAAEKPTPYDDPTVETPSDLSAGQQEFEERKNIETRIRRQKDGTFHVKSREEPKEAPEESQEHRDILAGTLRDLDSLTEANQQTRRTSPEPEPTPEKAVGTEGTQHTDDSGPIDHDGGTFEGAHKDGVPHEGKITYGDDGSTFEGKFTEDGGWHTGTHTDSDGTVTEHRDGDAASRTTFHPNGEKRSEGPLVGGKRDGSWRHYNEDGSVDSVGEWKDGLANGYRTHFHPNGSISQEGEYRNHEMVGEHRFYDKNGAHLQSNFHNEDGTLNRSEGPDGKNARDTGADPKSDLPPVSEMDDDALREELKGYDRPFFLDDLLRDTAELRDEVEKERAKGAAPVSEMGEGELRRELDLYDQDGSLRAEADELFDLHIGTTDRLRGGERELPEGAREKYEEGLRDLVERERAKDEKQAAEPAPDTDTPDAGDPTDAAPDAEEPEDPRDPQDMSHEELTERAIADENVPDSIKDTLREMPPSDANWDEKFAFIDKMMKELAKHHEKNENKVDWYALGKAMMAQDPFDALENWYGAFKAVLGSMGSGFKKANERRQLKNKLKDSLQMNVPEKVSTKTRDILEGKPIPQTSGSAADAFRAEPIIDDLAATHGDLARTAGDTKYWTKAVHEEFHKKYDALSDQYKAKKQEAIDQGKDPKVVDAAFSHTLDGLVRRMRLKNNADHGVYHPHTTATPQDHENLHKVLAGVVDDTPYGEKDKFLEVANEVRGLSSEHLNEFTSILSGAKDASPEERATLINASLIKLKDLESANREAKDIAANAGMGTFGPKKPREFAEIEDYAGPETSPYLDTLLKVDEESASIADSLSQIEGDVQSAVDAAAQEAQEKHEANKDAEDEVTGVASEEAAEEEVAPTFGEDLSDPQEGDTSLSFDHALKPDHNVGRGYRDHNGDGHYIRSKHVDKDGTVSYLVERINPNYLPGSPDPEAQDKFLHEKQSAEKLHRNMASGGDYKPSQVLWHGAHATNDRHAADSYNAELAEIKKRNGLPADFSSATREQQIRSGAFSEADKKYGKSINSDQNDKKASGGTRTKLANPKYNVGTGYVDENGNEFYIKDWFFDKAGEKDFYKVESISEDIGTNKEDTVEVDVVDRRLRSGDYQGKELAWHDAHAGRHPEGHISKEELARVDSARKDYHQERFSKKDEAAAARATPETPTDASKEQAEGEAPPASPPVGGPSEGAPPAAAGASEEQAAAPADPVEEAAKETETEVTPEGVAEEGVAAEEVPGEEEVATEEVTDDIADAAPLAGDEADPEVEDAEAVEEVAQEEAPRREDLGGSEGDSVDLHLTAGKSKIDKHPVQYRVVEADSITPSHKVSAGKFIKHENYPEGVQPRKYSGDDAKGVLERADNYEPGQVMSLDVGPNSGPPIVTKDGIVLGGNSRTMTKQHMYATGRGDTIRDHLMKNAEKFGVDPATIEGMNNPVLVRQMSDVHSQDMSPEDLNKLASQMNQSEAMAMTSEESATDLAKHLDKSEVLDKLAEDFDIDDHKTLNKFQESSDGQEFLTKFAEALGNKAPAYLEHNGRLSDTGRRAVNRAIGAHLVGDKEVFGRLEEKPKNKLSAIAFPSMLISKHPSAHDLGKDLKTAANAIDAIARYRDTLDDKGRKDFNRLTDDDKLDTMMSQGDLLDPDHPIGDNPRARALYNLIQNENQTDLKKTFEKMASSVKGTGAAQQDDMFAASPGPEAPKTTEELLSQAYQDATGRVLANEYQNTETGEDSYWGPPTEPEPEEVETEAAEVETPTEDAEAEVAETPTEDVAEAAEVEEVPTPEGEDVAEEAEVAEWSPAEKPTARTLGSINGVLGDSSPYSDVSNASKWDHHTNVEKAHKFTSPDGGVTVTGKGRKYTISGHGEESTATSMKAALTAAKALHDKMNVQADDMHKGGGEATKEDRDFLGDILGDSGTGCI